MRRQCSTWALAAACLALLSLGACSIKSETAPSRFYLLRPLPTEPSGSGTGEAAGVPALALGPVHIPAYLDRPQIVTRTPGSEVKLSEFERWAEPLEDNVTAVLADNLSRLVPTERVSVYPTQLSEERELRIAVEVLRFDGSLGGEVVLEARWRILGPDDALLRTERSRLTQPVSGAEYEALADAMSRALGALSRELALAVQSAARGL